MSKKQKYIIIGLVILAAGIRFYNLGAAALWYDEAFTDLATQQSLGDMYQVLAGDVHPPLYYLLIWPLQQIGLNSFAWLRMISAVASLASVILAGQLAYKVTNNRWAQIITVALMALSASSLRYAQEARMYALLELVVIAGLLAIYEGQKSILTIATASVMLLHNYGLFYALALALVAWGKAGKDWSKWIWPFAVSGLIWLPWGLVMFNQMVNISNAGYWIQPISLGRVVRVIYKLLFSFSVPMELYIGTMLMLSMGLVVVMAGVWKNRESNLQDLWPVYVMVMIPFGLAVIISELYRPILLFRPLVATLPPIWILASYSITNMDKTKQIIAAGILIPCMLGLAFGYHYFNLQNKADARTWIKDIRASWQPGDVVYTLNDSGAMSILEYAPDLPVYKMPDCPGQASLGALTDQTRAALGIIEKPQDQLTGRVWVVVSSSPVSPICEIKTAEQMKSQGQLVKTIHKNQYVDAAVYLREYEQ